MVFSACLSYACTTVAIGKARATCAQSFAPWEQATIEFTRRDHSIIACLRHKYILLFFAHILFVVNHTINATPPEGLQHYALVDFHVSIDTLMQT